METILLASSSPRRKEILESLGIPFKALSPDMDEHEWDDRPPTERVLALAEAKARAIARDSRARNCRLVLAADTLVADPSPLPEATRFGLDTSGHLVLGKPHNREEARAMLELLQGRSHAVHSGLFLLDQGTGRGKGLLSTSRVWFSTLSRKEMAGYLDAEEWKGVAGAYRIQGRAALFIERIEGSWSCIVGLPLREVQRLLTDFGANPLI